MIQGNHPSQEDLISWPLLAWILCWLVLLLSRSWLLSWMWCGDDSDPTLLLERTQRFVPLFFLKQLSELCSSLWFICSLAIALDASLCSCWSFFCMKKCKLFPFNCDTLDEMGSRIDELEKSINDLKAEMEADTPIKPNPEEDKPSNESS